MPDNTSPEAWPIAVGEKRHVVVNLEGKGLRDGELLTTPLAIVEVGTSVLTLADKAITTNAETVLGKTVAAGRAVQFTVDAAGATAGIEYKIKITCATTGDPTDEAPRAQTVIWTIRLKAVPPSP